jgi:fructokinase
MNLLLTITPDTIILGGGVMQTPSLLAKVRLELRTMINHYLPRFGSEAAIKQLIRAPAYPFSSGLVGAALLAQGFHQKQYSKE